MRDNPRPELLLSTVVTTQSAPEAIQFPAFLPHVIASAHRRPSLGLSLPFVINNSALKIAFLRDTSRHVGHISGSRNFFSHCAIE